MALAIAEHPAMMARALGDTGLSDTEASAAAAGVAANVMRMVQAQRAADERGDAQ